MIAVVVKPRPARRRRAARLSRYAATIAALRRIWETR